MGIGGWAAREAFELGRELVRDRVEGLRREAAAPWRKERSGAAERVGRWLGAGLALAAVAAGVAAALYASGEE